MAAAAVLWRYAAVPFVFIKQTYHRGQPIKNGKIAGRNAFWQNAVLYKTVYKIEVNFTIFSCTPRLLRRICNFNLRSRSFLQLF
jgi:hypothetical protein